MTSPTDAQQLAAVVAAVAPTVDALPVATLTGAPEILEFPGQEEPPQGAPEEEPEEVPLADPAGGTIVGA